MNTKRCTKCHEVKPIGEFNRDATKKDGMYPYCKACRTERSRKWRETHPEQARERSRKWRETHPEQAREQERKWRLANLEQERERKRKWRLANLEQEREHNRKWRQANPEQERERKRKWKKANPDKVQAYAENRRARLAAAPGHFTAAEWKALKEDYGHRCAYCNRPSGRLTADHTVALANGGTNDISNIVPACKSCNGSKNNTPLLVWLYRRLTA